MYKNKEKIYTVKKRTAKKYKMKWNHLRCDIIDGGKYMWKNKIVGQIYKALRTKHFFKSCDYS